MNLMTSSSQDRVISKHDVKAKNSFAQSYERVKHLDESKPGQSSSENHSHSQVADAPSLVQATGLQVYGIYV